MVDMQDLYDAASAVASCEKELKAARKKRDKIIRELYYVHFVPQCHMTGVARISQQAISQIVQLE